MCKTVESCRPSRKVSSLMHAVRWIPRPDRLNKAESAHCSLDSGGLTYHNHDISSTDTALIQCMESFFISLDSL